MNKKLVVLAAYLAAMAPMAVHAQGTTEVSSQPPGISDYVQCGVYYALIAECMRQFERSLLEARNDAVETRRLTQTLLPTFRQMNSSNAW